MEPRWDEFVLKKVLRRGPAVNSRSRAQDGCLITIRDMSSDERARFYEELQREG